MNHAALPFLFLCLTGAAPSASPAAESMDAGKWRMVIRMGDVIANGVARKDVPPLQRSTTTCLAGTGHTPAYFVENAGLPKECKIHGLNAVAGKISFTGICAADEDGMSFDLTGTGTYTATSMSVQIDARAESDGDQLSLSGTATFTRLGPCKAGK